MKKNYLMSGFLVCLSLAVSAAATSAALDFEGTWMGIWEDPHGGPVEFTLVLKKAQPGYSGIISDSEGLVEKETPLKDLTIDGNKISFSFPAMGGEQEFGLSLTIAGDKMTGELIFKAKGGGPAIEFIRKQ